MTHKYRKDYLTKIKGSKNWYIQFYIKDIYKDLPKIKNDPRWANRRNYLLSLETHDYSIAVKKVDEILKDIGIRSTPYKKLSQGSSAYFEVLKDLKVKTDNELDELYDIFTEMRNDSLQEIYETNVSTITEKRAFVPRIEFDCSLYCTAKSNLHFPITKKLVAPATILHMNRLTLCRTGSLKMRSALFSFGVKLN